MGIRSQNNPIAAYLDVFSNTGTDAAGAAAPSGASSGITATGGTVSTYTVSGNVYKAHVFAASGTFEVSSIGGYGANIEYLVVAGGGGGGGSNAGGGGAGGLRTNLPGVQTAGGTPLTLSLIHI